MRRRPVGSELVHMSLDPFLPRHAAVARYASGPASSGPARTPTRFQAFTGTEVLGLGPDEPVLPADSDEVRVRERHRGCTRWYVAVGAEAVVLALLIAVVGQQLMSVLGAGASGGGLEGLAHDLGGGSTRAACQDERHRGADLVAVGPGRATDDHGALAEEAGHEVGTGGLGGEPDDVGCRLAHCGGGRGILGAVVRRRRECSAVANTEVGAEPGSFRGAPQQYGPVTREMPVSVPPMTMPPTQAPPAIEVAGLTRVFRVQGRRNADVTALNGIDLALPAGSFTALVGASGCGKSTLLQCIAGLDAPTAGTVQLLGTRTSTLRPRPAARFRARHVGFVFQDDTSSPPCPRVITSPCPVACAAGP